MQAWGRAREVEKVKPKPGDEIGPHSPGFKSEYVPADTKQYTVCQVRGHNWIAIEFGAYANMKRCTWCGVRIEVVERELNPPKRKK